MEVKMSTAHKRIVANQRDAVGQIDGNQTGAAIECAIRNGGDGIGRIDGRQTAAVGKAFSPD